MKRVDRYVYDKKDPECSKLCDPDAGQLKQCIRVCTDHFIKYLDRIVPDPRPCPGFQYYEGGAETCEPCEKLCNPIASLEDCDLSCPEYSRYYNCTLLNMTGPRGDGEESCDKSFLIGACSFLTFLLILSIITIVLMRLHYRHCRSHQGEALRRAEVGLPLLELLEVPSNTCSDANDNFMANFFEETIPKENVKSEPVSEMKTICSQDDPDSLCSDDPQSTTLGNNLCEDNQQSTALEDTDKTVCENNQQTTALGYTDKIVCEENQQSTALDGRDDIVSEASSSDGCDTTRPKDLVAEPFSSTNTVLPVLLHTPSTPPSSAPLVSLRESVSTDHWTASSGSADATTGPLTIPENWNRPVSQEAIAYLMSQDWVRRQIATGNRAKVEIMVNGISLKDAKRQIHDNTSLESSQYTLTTFISCTRILLNGSEALHIANSIFFTPSQSDEGQRVSTIGGYLEHDHTDSIYLITSAHNGSKGTKYYCHQHMKPEDFIGVCKYWFCDDDLDIAFIELEDISNSKRLPRNILSLPGKKPGVYKPLLVDETFSDRGNISELLKHSRKVVRGELCEIIEGDISRFAMKGPPGESGLCNKGDSGALITSAYSPGRGGYLPAFGLVSMQEILLRESEDHHLLSTEVCIFTQIWPAVKKIAKIEGIHPSKFRFFEPGSRKLSGTQRVVKDTGYQSSPSKLQT